MRELMLSHPGIMGHHLRNGCICRQVSARVGAQAASVCRGLAESGESWSVPPRSRVFGCTLTLVMIDLSSQGIVPSETAMRQYKARMDEEWASKKDAAAKRDAAAERDAAAVPSPILEELNKLQADQKSSPVLEQIKEVEAIASDEV